MPIEMASQSDAALVARMAEQAREDGDLIVGARLTEPEARAFLAGASDKWEEN